MKRSFPRPIFVLVTATGPAPTLPIAMSMAAALPIVSTVTYTAAELLEDRHTAMMVSEPLPREIARRVIELRADPAMQWTIADKARAEAYEFFSLTRFLDAHRKLYADCLQDCADGPGRESVTRVKTPIAELSIQ
jgi:glycosyltransferase involved in cell wall biosynthesis